MLAAMTHPSRVLNLDIKAKLCYAKELSIYLSILQEMLASKVVNVVCI